MKPISSVGEVLQDCTLKKFLAPPAMLKAYGARVSCQKTVQIDGGSRPSCRWHGMGRYCTMRDRGVVLVIVQSATILRVTAADFLYLPRPGIRGPS